MAMKYVYVIYENYQDEYNADNADNDDFDCGLSRDIYAIVDSEQSAIDFCNEKNNQNTGFYGLHYDYKQFELIHGKE